MEEKRNKLPVTALIILMKEDKFLLLKRINTGYEDGKYSFLGGHVEKQEEIREAAIREAKEEIGITIKKEDLYIKHVFNIRTIDNAYIYFIFICNKWEGQPKIMEKDKCDEIKWVKQSDIPENTIQFVKDIFKEENKDEFYIPYGWEEN